MKTEGMHITLPKINLIIFVKRAPKAWIRKCMRYFERFTRFQKNKWWDFSMFLVDRQMHGSTLERLEETHVSEEFEKGLCCKFRDQRLDDVVEKFMKIRQERTMEDIIHKLKT